VLPAAQPFAIDGSGFGQWNLAVLDINIYVASLTDGDPPWSTQVLDRERYNLENYSLAPVFLQRIEAPAP